MTHIPTWTRYHKRQTFWQSFNLLNVKMLPPEIEQYYTIMDFSAVIHDVICTKKKPFLTEAIAEVNNDFLGTYQLQFGLVT